MASNLLGPIENANANEIFHNAHDIFYRLIQVENYVGDVYSMSYETALVLINDYYRQQVGGIPSLSFLVATRINLEDDLIDYRQEDSSVILLRVMDSASLPNAQEAERIRVETAQRVSGEIDRNWDDAASMDPFTSQMLSFAGVKCRVLGTFYLKQVNPDESDNNLELRFGDDISNYYPNRGLKVFKPNAKALEAIVNYRDTSHLEEESHTFNIGEVRYASTNRAFQRVDDVSVDLIPEDLLGQKSAVFGMTRTGKSNTTKIIIQSVFNLRFKSDQDNRRIGQIVFDPNGEYANENVQDDNSGGENPNAIKNIWQSNVGGNEEDVVTYGILEHPNDPDRNLMLLNFYLEENLQVGKEIIDNTLAGDGSKYIQNFRQVVFKKPPKNDRSAMTRYNRRVLAYRTLLHKADLKPPSSISPNTERLFNSKLIDALRDYEGDGAPTYHSAARYLSTASPTWSQMERAFEALQKFMGTQEYQDFENWYVSRPGKSGDTWADDNLKKILEMFKYPNGSKQIGDVDEQHSPETSGDYADAIYKDLVDGKLVIVDQSSGDPLINKSSSERIMWKIFHGNQALFRKGKTPHDILIYVEEAHNLLPAGSDLDLQDVWVRTAKEGAKYNLGLVYATQEVSSIQKNILKNTANWFIGHLNNTDETKELVKYYDFADFERSIRRAQDKGFLRVKTLSNRFVLPVQVKLFDVNDGEN